jgi:hypothetical protein
VKVFFLRLGLLGFGFLLAGTMASASEESPSHVVLLRDSVEVSHEVIQLADLLPASVPADLWKACAIIELGRAPQPGSLRVLDRGEVAQRLAAEPALLRRLQLPPRITVLRSGTLVRRKVIAQTILSFLRTRNWKESDLPDVDALRWSGGVTTREEDPTLEVTRAVWDDRRQALAVRLRCLDRSLCASFLVDAPAKRLDSDGEKSLTSQASFTKRLRVATESRSHIAPGPSLTQAGRHVSLILEGEALRISLPVVCLERGALGQQIRVRVR